MSISIFLKKLFRKKTEAYDDKWTRCYECYVCGYVQNYIGHDPIEHVCSKCWEQRNEKLWRNPL